MKNSPNVTELAYGKAGIQTKACLTLKNKLLNKGCKAETKCLGRLECLRAGKGACSGVSLSLAALGGDFLATQSC